MKKTICLLILLFLCLFAVSCTKENASVPITEATIIYDKETQDRDFTIKERKYAYDASDLVLMNVKNNSDQSYSIKIIMTFSDENGEEIETTEKSFSQFAAGFENHFLFMPGQSFANYTYHLEFTPYAGDCPATRFTAKADSIKEGMFQGKDVARKLPSVLCGVIEKNESNVYLNVGIRYVLAFDENGEIFSIAQSGSVKHWKPGAANESPSYIYPLYQTKENKINEWPSALQTPAVLVVVDGIEPTVMPE